MSGLVLIRPIFSEKSQNFATKGLYTFVVTKSTNKTQVKKAVEEQFGVKVASIKTQNYKPEIKRYGKHFGRTKAFKKAIVKVSQGSIGLWAPPEKTQNAKLKSQNDKSKIKNK